MAGFFPQYKRGSYIPIVVGAKDTFRTALYLDVLSAKYLDMFNKIRTYTEHTVTAAEEGRLDIVSNKQYGTPDLWWVIGTYNGIVNPVFETLVGTKLKIPDRNQVDSLLQDTNDVNAQTNTVDLL